MGFVNFIGDNSISIDAVEYETKLRSDDPQLLLPTEHVIYAFHGRGGKGRDTFALTSHRVLVRDKKGITGKRIRYISVPYFAVIAFSIETAGGIVDSDQELKLHCRGIGKVSIDFDCNVDSLVMYRFLSTVIFNTKGATGFDAKAFAHDATITKSGGGEGAVGSILNVLGSDYSQMNPNDVEAQIRAHSKGNVLVDTEKVEMAFKCGRDSFILTTHRLIKADTQGMSGKKVEYLSILWSIISCSEVGTSLSRERRRR